MTTLKLQLFGTFIATVRGKPVSQFRSDKIRALLIYLAVESDRPHSREFLATLLWPEMARADGLRNLRKSLSRLRQALGREASDTLLSVTRQTLAINRAEIEVDVLIFADALERVANHGHTAVAACPTCCQRLETALSVYKGEFLHGFTLADTLDFADWVVMQRETWHQRYLSVLQTVTAVFIEQEKWEQALTYGRRQVAAEPWREIAHRQLMQIYAGLGQMGNVQQQYARCRQILFAEMGAAPSTQTQNLYAALLQTEVAPTHPAPDAPGRVKLPRQFTSFVGRETVLAEINGRLDNPACALLTLLGPGGIGKTRVAIEAAQRRAHRYRDGVVFVPLAPLRDADDIAETIVDILELPQIGKQDSQTLLRRYLQEKELLLVLDNFEHVVNGVDVVVAILEQAPGVQMLVTSRTVLNLRAEWLYELPGLSVPADHAGQEAGAASALKLFQARLAQADAMPVAAAAEQEAMARICRLVAGMPLAIELAASQARQTGVAAVADALARSLDALRTEMRDVPPRHRSLRAVFDASWQALTAAEQAVLMRLSVFAGGFALEAAIRLAEASPALLDALQDKSFLHKTAVDRYSQHEVLRQFAREKLAAAGLETAVLQQHSHLYLNDLSRQQRSMVGPQGKTIMANLHRELANILQAWHSACAAGDAARLLHSHFALARLLYLRGLLTQGERAFAEAVTAVTPLLPADEPASPEHLLLTKLLNDHARFLLNQGDVGGSKSRAREALVLARNGRFLQEEARAWLQIGVANNDYSAYDEALSLYETVEEILSDRMHSAAVNDWEIRSLRASLYKQRCDTYWEMGDFEQANHNLEKALALDVENEDVRGQASCIHRQGIIARIQGAPDKAIAAFEKSMTLARLAGYSRLEQLLQSSLALAYSDKGDNKTAQQFFQAFYQTSKDAGDITSQSTALINLGLALARQGDYMAARTYYEQALQLASKLQNKRNEGIVLGNLGVIVMRLGDFAEAARLFEDSLAARLAINDKPGEMYSRFYMARLALHVEDYETAVTQCQQVLTMAAQTQVHNVDNLARTALGHAYAALGQHDQARACYEAALTHWQEADQAHLMLGPLSGLARLSLREDNLEEALTFCNQILDTGLDRDLESTFEPFDIWLTCVVVLDAVGDERSPSILGNAYALLQDRAACITNEVARQRFMQATSAHRQILRLAEEM